MSMAGRISIWPEPGAESLREAVTRGGASLAPLQSAEALIWLGGDPCDLSRLLWEAPGVRWVQLPTVGVDGYLELMTDGRVWTCARSVAGRRVAEHALMLALACLHGADRSMRRRTWLPRPTRLLCGINVVVVGAGDVGSAFIRLLRPFGVDITVVRRGRTCPPGADRVVTLASFDDVLGTADLLVLAAPLTTETEGLMDERRFELMRPGACIVNVGRGRLVVTDDLVAALVEGYLGGAGLDVTDPEPLPDGHPLWDIDGCLVTSHSASTLDDYLGELSDLVRDNTRRWLSGELLRGVVDAETGY